MSSLTEVHVIVQHTVLDVNVTAQDSPSLIEGPLVIKSTSRMEKCCCKLPKADVIRAVPRLVTQINMVGAQPSAVP